jgi:cystathionine beta-lyase/cystathionine gamma-synthase
MKGTCGLLSFIPKGSKENIMKFVRALEYFQWGCSWGGFESLVIPIGVEMSKENLLINDIPENLIRIHVGLENQDTLIADLENALNLL